MKDIKVFLKKKKQQYCCERFKFLLKEEKYKLVEYRKIIYNMRKKRLIIITRKYHSPLYKGKYKKLFFFFLHLYLKSSSNRQSQQWRENCFSKVQEILFKVNFLEKIWEIYFWEKFWGWAWKVASDFLESIGICFGKNIRNFLILGSESSITQNIRKNLFEKI